MIPLRLSRGCQLQTIKKMAVMERLSRFATLPEEDQLRIEPAKMHQLVSPELKKLAELFKNRNYEIRIAGGAVRDLLSGEKFPDDIDLATTATPAEMKKLFAEESVRTISESGEKHGTVTARIDDKENFEVTTLRIDKVTDGTILWPQSDTLMN